MCYFLATSTVLYITFKYISASVLLDADQGEMVALALSLLQNPQISCDSETQIMTGLDSFLSLLHPQNSIFRNALSGDY